MSACPGWTGWRRRGGSAPAPREIPDADLRPVRRGDRRTGRPGGGHGQPRMAKPIDRAALLAAVRRAARRPVCWRWGEARPGRRYPFRTLPASAALAPVGRSAPPGPRKAEHRRLRGRPACSPTLPAARLPPRPASSTARATRSSAAGRIASGCGCAGPARPVRPDHRLRHLDLEAGVAEAARPWPTAPDRFT